MRDNIVRAKIKRGEPVYGTMVTEFEHAALPVILADAGFDFFFLDLEHGMFSLQAVASGIHLTDAEQIKRWRTRGMTVLSCLTDLEMLRNSAQALGRALHE